MTKNNQIYYHTDELQFYIRVNEEKLISLFKTNLKLKTKIIAQEDKNTSLTLEINLDDRATRTPVSCLLFSPGGDGVYLEEDENTNGYYYYSDFYLGGAGGNLKVFHLTAEEADDLKKITVSILPTQTACSVFYNSDNNGTFQANTPISQHGGSGGGGGGCDPFLPRLSMLGTRLEQAGYYGGNGTYGGGGGGGGNVFRTNGYYCSTLPPKGGVSTGHTFPELETPPYFSRPFGGGGGMGGLDLTDNLTIKTFDGPTDQFESGGLGGYYKYKYDEGIIRKIEAQEQQETLSFNNTIEFSKAYSLNCPAGCDQKGYPGIEGNLSNGGVRNDNYDNPALGGGGGCGSNGGNGGNSMFPTDSSKYHLHGGGGGGGGFGANATGGNGGDGLGDMLNCSWDYCSGGGGGGGGWGAPGGDGYFRFGGGGGGYGINGQGGSYNQKPGYAAGGSYAYDFNGESYEDKPSSRGKFSDPTGGPGICIIYYYTY